MKVKWSSNRLYKLIIEETRYRVLMSAAEESAWLWHSRLGHVNFQAMMLMSKHKMADGFPNFVQPKDVCKGCLLSKQARKPFPHKANYSTKQRLELLHADLCGPITPQTPAGKKYFFLLVDDFSKMMWVYMLKSKDEALGAFKKFKVWLKMVPLKEYKS